MIDEFAKHPGWQIVRGPQDLTARIAMPQHDILSIADTNTILVTPERSSPATSASSSAASSSRTLSLTSSRETQMSAIREVVLEALSPIKDSINQLQTGFVGISTNVSLIARQVDVHHSFLEALHQSGQLQQALLTRQTGLLPAPTLLPNVPLPPLPAEEPMPPGADE